MPAPRHAIPALALAALALAGCARNRDNFNPQIVIVDPPAGAVRQTERFEVRGYALDDRGIRHLYILGRDGPVDLLRDGSPLAPQRGQKLVRFSFPAISSSSGSVAYQVRAVDVNGRETQRELHLVVDREAPKLTIDTFEGQADTVTIAGRAGDNVKVARVLVNGQPLNISPGPKVDFYAETPRTRIVTVIVLDGAGNRYQQNYTSPPPGPPAASPTP